MKKEVQADTSYSREMTLKEGATRDNSLGMAFRECNKAMRYLNKVMCFLHSAMCSMGKTMNCLNMVIGYLNKAASYLNKAMNCLIEDTTAKASRSMSWADRVLKTVMANTPGRLI